MHSEVLLYGYGAVCLSMLVFNIVYSLILRSDQKRMNHKTLALADEMETQLVRIRGGEPVMESHVRTLAHYLRRIGNLLAFDELLNRYDKKEPEVQAYIDQCKPALLQLASVYWKKEDMQAAYYCYFLASHLNTHQRQIDDFQRAIMAYIDKQGLYCRINAFRALCAFGSEQSIVEGLFLLNERSGAQLTGKVLVESLLSFSGDSEKLIGMLWEYFDRFPVDTQRALMDFTRFQSGKWHKEMLDILKEDDWDKELKLSAIRYFDKYPYAPAKELLLDYVARDSIETWEYAAIACTALAHYEGTEVLAALSGAIHSRSWYVRFNAAASLEAHGLTSQALIDIAGEDKYARDMLRYRFERRTMTAQKEEAKA